MNTIALAYVPGTNAMNINAVVFRLWLPNGCLQSVVALCVVWLGLKMMRAG